jgi:hypothetical protein
LKKLHELMKTQPYLSSCRIISDSDAHRLEDIHEPDLVIPVREKSTGAVLDYLLGN